MNLPETRSLALSLMKQHNLQGWIFRFNGRPFKRFGICYKDRKVIELSSKLVLINEEPRVRNVILHEIGHALAPKGAGHGPVWRRIAREIGATDNRCYSVDDGLPLTMPEPKYKAVCPKCSKEHYKNRLVRRYFACSVCCNKYNGGKYSIEFLLTYRKIGI